MADIQWIKIASNIFDNRKVKMIESMPEGYAIIIVWIKLLCLAGNINDMGMVYFTNEIPYTEQMLSTQFNMPLSTVQLALRTFEQFGMIEVIDSMLHISNWEKYQNIEGMEKIRESKRMAQARWRAKKKLLPSVVDSTVDSTVDDERISVDYADKNKKRKEEEKDILYINNNSEKNSSESSENVENSVEEKIAEQLDELKRKKASCEERGFTELAKVYQDKIDALIYSYEH